MKLFVVYIGGTHPQALIELHDIRFVVGNNIEDTYDALRKSWWGTPSSLHLDAWGVVDHIDGFSVKISEHPSPNLSNKLYFVNLGGYDSKQFTELHKNIFVVAENEKDAKQKALQQVIDWQVPHRDYMYEVDKILDVNQYLKDENRYIHLHAEKNTKPFKFTCDYIPLRQTS